MGESRVEHKPLWEAWKRSRIPDALQELEEPRIGEALLLARLSLNWNDDLFQDCAIEYLIDSVEDANFVLADYVDFYDKRETSSLELIKRYIDFILPEFPIGFTIEKLREAFGEDMYRTLDLIAHLDHLIGSEKSDLLFRALEQLVTNTTLVVYFTNAVKKFSTSQEESMHHRICRTIIEPNIRNLEFNDWPTSMKGTNEVNTEDLGVLIPFMDDSSLSSSGRVRDLIKQMLTFEQLNPRDLKVVLPQWCGNSFHNNHIRRWGDIHR